MESYLDTEVIAGIILGLYFIIKGVVSARSRGKVNETTIKDIVQAVDAKREREQILSELETLTKMLEDWDDKIHEGEFSSPWTEREVQTVLVKLDTIIRSLSK